MSYKVFDAGSVFNTSTSAFSYKVETAGSGLTMLNRIFPVGSEISFDGIQGRIPLFPYHTILKKWNHFFEVHVPAGQTIVSAFEIIQDLQLRFLVWNERDPLINVFHPRRERFALRASAQAVIKNIDFPEGLTCYASTVTLTDTVTVEYEAGLHYESASITAIVERGHLMLRNVTNMSSAGVDINEPVNYFLVKPLASVSTNFLFSAR